MLLKNRFFISVLFLFLFLYIFFVYISQFPGPAYLSDEIGYLSKAIALSGHYTDRMTKWHAGYSIVLSPLFLVLNDPVDIWKAIQILNLILLFGSLVCTFIVVDFVFKDSNFKDKLVSMLFVFLYPSWVVMVSYSFSSVLVLFLYSLVLVVFIKLNNKSYYALLLGFLCGFQYWVHPTALAVIFSLALTFFVLSKFSKDFRLLSFFIFLLTSLSMIFYYEVYFESYLEGLMGVDVSSRYVSSKSSSYSIGSVIEAVSNKDRWLNFVAVFFGVFSSNVISSFGLVAMGLLGWSCVSLKESFLIAKRGGNITVYNLLPVFCFCSYFSLIFLQALFSLKLNDLRVDWTFYNRYLDPYSMIFLAIGALVLWKAIYRNVVLLFLFSVAVILFFLPYFIGFKDNGNLVNIPSFWVYSNPFFDYIVALYPNGGFSFRFFVWVFFSGIVIYFVTSWAKKMFLVVFFFSWLYSVYFSGQYHKSILKDYSNSFSINEFFEANSEDGECVVFDINRPENSVGERYNLLSFYLHNYDLKRRDVNYWNDSCDGFFITQSAGDYKYDFYMFPLLKNLYGGWTVFSKTKSSYVFDMLNSSDYYINGQVDKTCFYNDCIYLGGNELLKFSQVGLAIEERISTTMKKGFMFYGPYKPLKKGNYRVSLQMQVKNIDGAVVDISHDAGKILKSYSLKDVVNDSGNYASFDFTLNEDSENVEVRLFVEEHTNLKVERLSVVPY